MSYDKNNIFARILRNEIPCKKVYEDDYVLAFYDINPQAPTHVLIIPKGNYISLEDFTLQAKDDEIVEFMRSIGKVSRMLGVSEQGYRILSNCGKDANQEVPHLHVHIFGGKNLGPMLTNS